MKKPSKKNFFRKKKTPTTLSIPTQLNFENLRLNKFMAHSGIGTRRACEIFIQKGLVKVNDEVVMDSAYRVQEDDKIEYEGRVLKIDKQYVYVLLNKPKGYLPTFEISETEKTFHHIFSDKIKTIIAPIGSLNKESVGLLLLTDDEFLLEKYSKPEHPFKFIFHIVLSNPISKEALQNVQENLIENHPNIRSISHVKGKGEEEVGLEMMGGTDVDVKNFFEKNNLSTERIDRVTINGLTKKDLPRGRFRLLSEKEAIFLKHF